MCTREAGCYHVWLQPCGLRRSYRSPSSMYGVYELLVMERGTNLRNHVKAGRYHHTFGSHPTWHRADFCPHPKSKKKSLLPVGRREVPICSCLMRIYLSLSSRLSAARSFLVPTKSYASASFRLIAGLALSASTRACEGL